MSKMGLLGAIGFSLALVSLTQIPNHAEGCKILSAASSGPSSILVQWEKSSGATNYFLDLRVKGSKDSTPVVVSLPSNKMQKDVRGLRPGTEYTVTLKVFKFFSVVCSNVTTASTVPDTSQIESGRALSSSSVFVKWTEVSSAQSYNLLVRSEATGRTQNITSTNLSAVVTNLEPSTRYDFYVYTSNRAGLGGGSKVRTITTLVPPPVNMTVEQTDRSTARVTWSPVKDVLIYRVTIKNLDEPASSPSVKNVTDTELVIHDILPCSTYQISVSSLNKFLLPGEPRHQNYTTNKLRPVSSVTVDYSCPSHSAEVHWSAVFGADSYTATAVSENGTELTCGSRNTSCRIDGLSCGQHYLVHVTPMSDNCRNTVNNTTAAFSTVPCAPKNLDLYRDCSSEVIVFTWDHTNGSDYYRARAEDSKGVVQECLTEDNSCIFTRTVCGRRYFFRVYSVTEGCRSEISSTVDIRTAPCIPQNLQTSSDCKSDVVLSKWDLAEGALRYTVDAYGNRGIGNSHYNCSSMSNSCAMEGIKCGEYLTVFITAYDDECASPRMLGPVAETVPCVPKNVSAIKECGSDSITTEWAITGGAIFYVAIAKDDNGDVHNCNSIELNCEIKGLKCSTNYTVSVIASNFMCNSSESEAVTIETAACPPQNVTASLDCAANEALIAWQGQPELNSYTAIIVDEDQGLLSCSSATTSCRVPNLKCGRLYTVTVSYHDGMCLSIPSQAIYLESVPCGPADVRAHVDCPTAGLTVGWNASRNAEGYITEISDGSVQESYNTTQPALSVATLGCGGQYSVKVTSFNGTCVSFASVVPVREVPCVPTDVTAKRNCGQSFVEVTWRASRGAKNYTAAAVGEDGSHLECVSNETSCRLEGVACGHVYNVSVSAVDDACSSAASPAVHRATAPCPPSHLSASVNCSGNSAALTWGSSPNAASYTGRAASADGHNVTCEAGAELGCQLEGLRCGTEYTFTVSASDGDCQSPDSTPVVHKTAPCAVQNVLNALNCSTNALTVSWTPGSMRLNYSVTARDGNGSALHCTTEDSGCTLDNLKCGQQYTVTVRAVGGTCDGHSSVPEVVDSVPCVPANVQGDVECSTNTLRTSWDASAGASSYVSALTGAAGFSASCPTADQSCRFSGLRCAQMYDVRVLALGGRCNSSLSSAVSATTAPCDPTNVTAALHCLSGVVTVTWGAGAGANRHTVVAEADGHVDSCNVTGSAGASCELSGLRCGEDYTVTVLAGDGTCNSSVLAKTNVTTAPCAPLILNHTLDCVSNRATVTWRADEDAAAVTVNATSGLGHWASCSSSAADNNSCVLDALRCGHTYTVRAEARGDRCLSKPSAAFQIVTAPCTPANVDFTYSCETGIALLSWDETLGRRSFYALISSESHAVSCDTTQTGCSPPSLLCGRTYHVTVTAVADHCNSSAPGVAHIQTAPCPPMNISTSLVCDNNTAAVSWQPSPGAVSYKVTAQGRDGDVRGCAANDTACHLPNLHCGQTYVITITPFSSRCRGLDSYAHNFVAGACPPTNVAMSLQCAGNVGHVTWDAAPQADGYVATAVDDQEHTCTSNGTGCSLTDLECGMASVVTVVTMDRGCPSKPSRPFTFQSVICPPSNVTGATNCSNNDITVSWDPSPEPGVQYFLHTQQDGGAAANYSTTQTSYVIAGLRCDEMYSLTVAARDSRCTSVLSKAVHTETAPCPPTNLTVSAECGTNLGKLSWAPSAHAVSYTATATGTHGHVISCSSNTTSCSVKLDCGHQYAVAVVAYSETCSSGAGASVTFNSAPCLPDRVVADLDCSANSFAVQWRGSVGDVGSYTAIAIGSDDTRATCDSTNTNCTIGSLNCGVTYSIVVTTPSVDCGTIQGSDYLMQSAPCKPANVSVNLQCGTNLATVVWGNSGPNQTAVVRAEDSRGDVSTCNSNGSSCTLDRLTCGESYVVSVVGHTNSCNSEPVVARTLKTAPCVPTFVMARVDCRTGITVVTWDSASGATSYTVYARGSLGHNAECNNTDTNCDFPNLACGQDYNVTVVARHESCVSLVSEATVATTGPCPHSGLKTALDCSTNTAAVSWTPGSGIRYYNASADAFGSSDQQTCSTNGTACNVTSLQCGASYKVSVSGQGQFCPSPAQDWNRINTAPCPPTALMVNSSCESNDIWLSWRASRGSFSYTAAAEDERGRRWTCNATGTSCQISDLLCGQRYQVYVVGVDQTCTGARSNVEVIHTAPCVPQNIQNNLDCLSGVLNVTWESTGHVSRFRASVAGGPGRVSTCATGERHCLVRDLRCDQTYNVTVAAEDETCNSSHSATEQVLTAPCPLPSFLPTVNCSTGVVSVTWSGSVAGVLYTVSAADATGRRHNCTGTSGGCDLGSLDCGTEYNVSVTPSRDGCVGRDSPTKLIRTVPCVPQVSDVEIDCLTNSAWVIFEESAGAEDYVSTVTDVRGNVRTFACNATSEGICALPQLMCSENLTFSLEARDQQCSSPPSNAVTTETAPCPPQDVKNKVDCGNATISIAWSAVPGAVTYTAMLGDMNANTTCCTASDTGCDITGLPCGEFYVLYVTAEGRTCNSSQSRGNITRTAPCSPQNLKANLSCSNNVASMSWDYSARGQLFRVTASSAGGHEVECVSHDNRCDLTGLRCGQRYTAAVTAEDIDCRSKPSESVTIKTVPCTPANVSSAVSCDARALIVSWSESAGADSHIATVQDSDGRTTTCQGAADGSCNVTGLGCGQVYHVFVVSSDGYCDSQPTPVVDTPSVPCKARNIKAVFDCNMKTASVEWLPSDGALSYVATAVSAASGHNISCDTNGTSCDLDGLRCGQSYSVSVEAVGWSCSSVARMTGQLLIGPCVPERISPQYSLTIGQVLWDRAAGADDYTVEGVTAQGRTVSCATNDTYCAIDNLDCGQLYNVTVTANNRACRGVAVSTETVVIETEPCPPNNVATSVRCQDDVGTVSWEASTCAVGYVAQLSGRDGHFLSCYTNATFCDVHGLHCGVTYYTSVVAVGTTLNSSASTTVLLVSAPCAAADVAVDLDCGNSSAVISWSSSDGADSYAVTAAAADGYRASCETDELRCELTGLQCGQTYNVSLAAVSDRCRTETHTNATISTGPCKPRRVGADLQCGTSAASLYWEESEGVELYLATATPTSGWGSALQCNTTNSTCLFSNLHCGETYEFSVTAYANECYSDASSTVEVQTEPCRPSGLSVNGSCYNETVQVEWAEARGASVYLMTAAGNLGYVKSFQTNETTVEAELPCGQLFTFTVKARGEQCDGAASPPEEFKTGPCIPRDVQSFTRCEDSMGSVSWAPSDGAESYLAIAAGRDEHVHDCATNGTVCTWDDLHCGEEYTVHVIAIDYMCSSLPSNSTTIRMAPCIPQNLQSSLNCTTKVGSLTWNSSESAEFYIVTAQTNGGHKVQLSTNSTWTFISEFLCGQEYFLSVQAAHSECRSRASLPSKLESEPCQPTNVSSFINCLSNIVVVSWNGSAGAKFYTATVTPSDGQSQRCLSDGEQCGMPNVYCGQNYTVTVFATNDKCNSDPSEPTALQSVPCVPTDVEVTMDCSKNHALVSWNSSEGALSYKVTARSSWGGVSSCETAGLKCTLTNLTCGHAYTVQVVAQDDICSSLPSPAKTFHSVPCRPGIGSLVVDCFTNSALMDWTFSRGALDYTATARSSSGHVSTCTSNFTNCELRELRCGQIYNAIVVASNGECSSPPSSRLQVESVPCPPERVVPVLDCSTNTARVEWEASSGADSYVVQAFGVQEDETGCETSSRACTLPDLMCGFTYNISVIAVNGVCNVSQSAITQLQAVPCVPRQVEARLVCESGAVAVSWEPSKGASSYTAVAQGNGGYASTCNSTETTCLFDDLPCGRNYSVTVSAADDTCTSAGSSAVEINSLPCVPQKVTAETICSNDTGVVCWEGEEGVSSYRVRAFGPDGHRTECGGVETCCRLHSLHCGQLYNLTVTAQDGQCNNSRAYLNLQPAPCSPTNVKASLRCRSNSVAVTWERASGAASYLALGVTADGSHRTTCNNTLTHCDLSELRCGQTYNVSVFGQDESCSSVESDKAYVRTAPCAPQNVSVDAECAEGAITVSWSPNPDAQYFHVAAVTNTGGKRHCNSSSTTCTINDLPCGQSYNVTVLSVRGHCESRPSAAVETSSAPCVPRNARGSLDCVSNSAWVAWDDSEGALSYVVRAQGEGGHNSSCTSTSPPCSVPDLKCGTLYNFSVTAVNKHCSSNDSTSFELETGPCALTSISAVTQCNSDTILVEWEETLDTPLYLVTAEGHDQKLISCNSSTTSCVLQDIRCGMQYNIIVSASSDKCSSLRSPPKKIKTAPCAPQNVSVMHLCEEKGAAAAVTWERSPVATSYALTATGRDGHVASCNSSVNNCTLTDLRCGQPYSVSVTASGDNCTSFPSNSSFRTVPCMPSGLAVDIDCENKSAVLSWNASEGAVKYYGCARPEDGAAIYCDSIGPSCTLEGLTCGEIYNFSVEASNGVCNSSFSTPLTAGAVPCPPTAVNARMQKIDSAIWARLSWDSVNCSDVMYLAEITGSIKNDPQALMDITSYWLPRNYFEFQVPCSTTYNITVRAKNRAGVSAPSSTFTGVTIPCAPQNVKYSGSAQSGVLSWDASVFATRYTVYSVSGGGRVQLCSTAGLSCQLTDFNSSATEVTASNAGGESNPSRDITGARRRRDLRSPLIQSKLGRDLETPVVLNVTANKVSLYVKWSAVRDAAAYTLVIAEEPPQDSEAKIVRAVEGTFYEETDLKPRTTYSVRLAAKNAVSLSDYSRPNYITTGTS